MTKGRTTWSIFERSVCIGFSFCLTCGIISPGAVQAGPTAVMTEQMYTGRSSAPLPVWMGKNSGQTGKKQRKKNVKKPQTEVKPSTTDQPSNKQTQQAETKPTTTDS